MSQLSQDGGVELSQASALSLSHLADNVDEPLSQVLPGKWKNSLPIYGRVFAIGPHRGWEGFLCTYMGFHDF